MINKTNTPNYNPSSSGDIFTALRQIVKTYLSDFLFTAEPMQVVGVNSDGSLNLLPVLEDITTLGDSISNTTSNIIANIKPIYFLGGGTEISFESKIGDFGLLVACKKDISNYISNHSQAEIGSLRQFSLSNGFFFPMDFFGSKKTCLTIKRQNDTATSSIILDDTGIVINTNKDITANVTGKMVATITGDAEITAKNIKGTANTNVEISSTNAIINSTNIVLGGSAGGKNIALNGDSVVAGGAVIGTIVASSTTTKAI